MSLTALGLRHRESVQVVVQVPGKNSLIRQAEFSNEKVNKSKKHRDPEEDAFINPVKNRQNPKPGTS